MQQRAGTLGLSSRVLVMQVHSHHHRTTVGRHLVRAFTTVVIRVSLLPPTVVVGGALQRQAADDDDRGRRPGTRKQKCMDGRQEPIMMDRPETLGAHTIDTTLWKPPTHDGIVGRCVRVVHCTDTAFTCRGGGQGSSEGGAAAATGPPPPPGGH